MDNTMVDPNTGVNFHPVFGGANLMEEHPAMDHKQKVAEHVSMHYRKYLFGIGALSGFVIAFIAWMFFGTSATTQQTKAAYESLTPKVNAIILFNQMDAIAHEKDNFFHQSGKIYTLSGETLFHRYDTMFHVLDNAYHRSVDTDDKLKRALRLEEFLNEQNKIFAATAYSNPEEDQRFDQLDQQFLQMIQQIESESSTGANKTISGTIIAQ